MKKPSTAAKVFLGILLLLIMKTVVLNALMIGEMKDHKQWTRGFMPGTPTNFTASGLTMPIPAPIVPPPTPAQTEPTPKPNANPYSSN